MSGPAENPWRTVAGAGRPSITTISVPTVCQAVISPQTRHRGRDTRDLGSATVQGVGLHLIPTVALGSAPTYG